MVFSAPLMTTTTTGTIPHQAEEPATPTVIVDPLPSPYFRALHEKATNKHDVGTYTVTNASFIGLAGFVAGLQEAFYTFEKMPPDVTRRTFLQAWRLGGIIGRKTLLGTAIGATFCYTEATLENARHTHDSWNGMASGAAAGAVFAMLPYKPWPQPVAWPLFFAAAAWTADLVSEKIPFAMKGYKTYGAVPGRENWNDPEPPRPPILETGSATKPYLRNFWRGE